LSAWHDGYRRLPGKPIHSREIEWTIESGLCVTDHICSSRPYNVFSRLHLHPTCQIDSVSDRRVLVSYAGGLFAVVWTKDCRMNIEEGWYFPEFGIKKQNKIITFIKKGSNLELYYHILCVV
jgi:uncharacterized heparinase superfamily protein